MGPLTRPSFFSWIACQALGSSTALAQAEAQLLAALTSIQSINAQITVQQAQIAESQAQVQQTEASLVFARQQADRFDMLARTGAGSVQSAQQYDFMPPRDGIPNIARLIGRLRCGALLNYPHRRMQKFLDTHLYRPAPFS